MEEKMKPFKAWVAWHPNEEQRMKCGRWENDIFFDKVCIDLSEEEVADGWRIVEVEVREAKDADRLNQIVLEAYNNGVKDAEERERRRKENLGGF